MKKNRHDKIIEIINNHVVETQEQLAALLKDEGYDVTQATVSRDIREMKLTKVADASGKLRYVAFKTTQDDMNEKYIRIFLDGFVSMDNATNILVVKTVSGMAMAVAAALDHMDFPEIVGSIAGDDTIMCAVRTLDDTVNLMGKLKRIIDRSK